MNKMQDYFCLNKYWFIDNLNSLPNVTTIYWFRNLFNSAVKSTGRTISSCPKTKLHLEYGKRVVRKEKYSSILDDFSYVFWWLQQPLFVNIIMAHCKWRNWCSFIHSLISQRFIKLLEDPRHGSEYWDHHRENVLQSRLIGIYFLMGKVFIQWKEFR